MVTPTNHARHVGKFSGEFTRLGTMKLACMEYCCEWASKLSSSLPLARVFNSAVACIRLSDVLCWASSVHPNDSSRRLTDGA